MYVWFPIRRNLISHKAELADAQSMQAKRYSGGSNKTDLWEGFCDWSTLIAHSGNFALWDIVKHILAERNRQNEATINHKRSVNSALRQFHTMRSHPKTNVFTHTMVHWNIYTLEWASRKIRSHNWSITILVGTIFEWIRSIRARTAIEVILSMEI